MHSMALEFFVIECLIVCENVDDYEKQGTERKAKINNQLLKTHKNQRIYMSGPLRCV